MPKVARVSCSVLLIITSGCACGPAKFVTPNTQATVEPTVEPTVLPTVASERATPLESPRNGSAGTDGTHVLPVVFDIQVPADGMQIPTVPVAPAESSVADERGSTAPDKVTGTAPNPAPPTPLLSDMNGDAITSAAALQLNFPSAMALVDSRHPIVGIARWRVRESYGQLARAQMLWLPSIQAGFSFHRHDGNYQASNGDIVDVKRSSFQFGLGAGATGAGTTSARPGLIAQFHLADAIFQPKIMEKTAWARGHAANATLNEQLMNTGIAYIELVDAYQGLRIADETRLQMAELARITDDFATAGEGLRSDADRLQTELRLIEVQVFAAEEQIALASARLAHAASIDPCHRIVPLDVNAVPLELADVESDSACLISTALRTRPELKESQALVAAACEAHRREKYAPYVPSVLVGFSHGGFGGGIGSTINNVDDRYDLDAVVTWELRNLGLGEHAAKCTNAARVEQAKFEKLRVMDEVSRQVSEALAQIQLSRSQISSAQLAIQSARDSHARNLDRIREGEGLPIESLQSVQALAATQRAYLDAVTKFNRAQLRLQWAMGWPSVP